jgi:hypothetical protein
MVVIIHAMYENAKSSVRQGKSTPNCILYGELGRYPVENFYHFCLN